ncbi:MAG: polysaccharide deacetylase family protein [Actinomycetota bacterium]|nr:polysaccharide deacetylase family protein [Actinomycetota bacterium]
MDADPEARQPLDAETLRARREGVRRKRRLRRRRSGLGLAGLAVLAAAVLVSQAAGGGSGAARPVATASHSLAQPPAQAAALTRLIGLGLPVYCAGNRGNRVALTFDDGPGPYTRIAIGELRRARVRTTWFLVGRNLAGHESLVGQERQLGVLADHTWTHRSLPTLSAEEAGVEMSHTQTSLAALGGRAVQLFRPPYGARNPETDAEAKRLGMVEVLWNVDSEDSAGADKRGIARNVIAGLRPGSIVLMHENRGQTIAALRRILPALHRRHLRGVSLPELLSADPPSDAQLRAGPRGCHLYGSAAAGLRAGRGRS